MNEVEDEFHFMFICPKYSILRRKYIDNYYFRSPSMYKLFELFIKKEKKNNFKRSTLYRICIISVISFSVQLIVISSLCSII